MEVFEALEILNKVRPLTETKIYSRLQGFIKVALNYRGCVIEEPVNHVVYNKFGKVFEKGECLLFPDDKCSSWEDFVKKLIMEEHEKELTTGCICLVKRIYTDPWILAVYNKKLDNSILYQAKVGKDYEAFQFCISFENNKEYLGRESFPDWYECVSVPENP
jgi:hypothetical protein